MRFIYFLVFGEYFCSKGVSLSDIGFTLIFSEKFFYNLLNSLK